MSEYSSHLARNSKTAIIKKHQPLMAEYCNIEWDHQDKALCPEAKIIKKN